nr:alpha/beta hydrolase [Sulfitobacter aestuariivivens]
MHCTLAFGGAWAGIARQLGDSVTLVAPDMPSHGKSADWDGVSDFSDTVYAASLGVMDAEPMDVIGHSFGAATALRIAVAHPERVRSLTMFEPVFFAVAQEDDPQSMVSHNQHAAPFFEAMEQGDSAVGARAFNRMWSGAGKWDSLPERARAAMVRAIHVVPGTHGFLFDDTEGLLRPGVLEAVRIPTAVMRGEHALPVIIATNDGLARRLGNAENLVIEGAGHMGPITHARAVADHIAAVMARG